MPILGGPGSIAAVVTVAAAYPTMDGRIGTALGTAALVGTLFVCFAFSGFLSRFLNHHAQEIILRFMGLILVAIGGDMILGGIETSASHFFLGVSYTAKAVNLSPAGDTWFDLVAEHVFGDFGFK